MLHNTGQSLINYDLIGPPEAPVVCMTHSLTSDYGMWAEQVPSILAEGFQVLRVDMRGHGGSTPTKGEYTIEGLAADVISVLDALGFDKGVHLIGLSMGGMIGQVIAADYPGRLASLMACCTAAKWAGDTELMLGRLAAVKASGTLESIVSANMERRYGAGYRERRPKRWEALRETFLGTSLDGYFGCMHACLTHNVEDRLQNIDIPTLVVAGSADLSTPPSDNKLIASKIKGARYVEMKDGYHFPNIEFDEDFNRIMVDWLRKVRG
ncbi:MULTISPECIES: alpha/beta fold hydrolase [unclassified Chelatococcus]|uniref:alpha/beta fold hydrolase n=1 Tax=unclassified Chelatococcus TaxID=2638111 RepID=UPI001BD071D3|nr:MULTISPECIES: alpha/beta fold hydrolase [unclassified Chelatococcus]MBS7700121.1 alpha/beta fold hydrolase [Chelatococcus sp. YT9]MBX3556814.1 alpha/beta fold hydrolase [Chelatococcus sp.]